MPETFSAASSALKPQEELDTNFGLRLSPMFKMKSSKKFSQRKMVNTYLEMTAKTNN